MTLLQFKLDNEIEINTLMIFDNKSHVLPEPWNCYYAMEKDKQQAVIIFSLETSQYKIWSNVPRADLTTVMNELIEKSLDAVGFSTNDKLAITYPSMENGFYFYKGKKRSPDYDGLANYFKNEINLKNDDTYVCVYENNFYRDLSKIELLHKIDVHTRQQAKGTHVDHFKKTMVARCFFPKDKFEPPEGLVNLENGVLNVKTKELLDHDADYNFRYKLSHRFDLSATAPKFIEFLDFIFDGDADLVRLIGEIMGYTLIGGEPFKHKAFIFYGEGRNGKSTLLDVIKELLGKHSVSAVSMQRINEPFSMVRMDGKLANIVEESPGMINAEAFKNIVSGGEVSAARKHMDEFDLKIKARMFFACNDYPHFKDSSKGLKDRLTIIPFNKYIPERERDSKIKERLFKEMPGILNFALEGYSRLLENNLQFTKSKAVEASVSEYLSETDSVVSWAQDHVMLTFNAEDKLSTKELYNSYKECAKQDGFMPCANNTFSKRFKRYLNDKGQEDFNSESLYFAGKKSKGYRMMLFSSIQ